MYFEFVVIYKQNAGAKYACVNIDAKTADDAREYVINNYKAITDENIVKIVKLGVSGRFEALYKEIDALLNLAPVEDDCTDEENDMYSEMANLKEAMFDAGYGR